MDSLSLLSTGEGQRNAADSIRDSATSTVAVELELLLTTGTFDRQGLQLGVSAQT